MTITLGSSGSDHPTQKAFAKYPLAQRLLAVKQGSSTVTAHFDQPEPGSRPVLTFAIAPASGQARTPEQGKGMSSQHPGGLNILLCDGAVRFLPETVDRLNVQIPLCEREDGLTFQCRDASPLLVLVRCESSQWMGYTHDGGKYSLIRGRGNRSIPVGEYRVTVSQAEVDEPQGQAKVTVPAKYTTASNTDLKANVQSGPNTIDFDLQSQ